MGWYAHPDTLTFARAQGMADRLCPDRDSKEWVIAYRDSYHQIAEPAFRGLSDYLERIDQAIEKWPDVPPAPKWRPDMKLGDRVLLGTF